MDNYAKGHITAIMLMKLFIDLMTVYCHFFKKKIKKSKQVY